MSIQVNAGAGAVNWETLLSKIGTVSKTPGADGKETLTVTMKSADGKTTYTVGIPNDLEPPGKVDQSAIDSLCAKLSADKATFNLTDEQIAAFKDALVKMLGEISANANPQSKSVMFDLYKLMALLVEVAQRQRDAARQERLTESAMVQNSIMAQASQQRTAAITAMAASIATCAVQVGFSLYTVGKEGSAFRSQMKTLDTSGVTVAKEGVHMLNAADKAVNAQNQLNATRAAVGNEVANRVEQGFSNSATAQQRYAAAQAAKTGDEIKLNRVQDMNQPLQDADIPPGSKLAEAKAKLDAYNEMQQLDAKDPSTRTPAENMKLVKYKTDVNVRDASKADLEAAVRNERTAYADELRHKVAETHPQAIESARQTYRAALKDDLLRYENEYANAQSERALLPENATPAQKAAAEVKVADAAANLKYARAYAGRELAAPGVTTANERAADIRLANAKVDAAQDSRKMDEKFLEATRNINKFQAYNNIITAIGNVAQSGIQSVNAIMQSYATEKNAAQQKAQESLDQTKDLFAQAEDLIKQVVQLMQAIFSAETESMRDAIKA